MVILLKYDCLKYPTFVSCVRHDIWKVTISYRPSGLGVKCHSEQIKCFVLNAICLI